jgi:outer membrane receptor protein involved in Fe transport
MNLKSSMALAAALAAALTSTPSMGDPTEIIVTTRKREENLQQVPISVSAFSEELIEKRGVQDIGDVAKLDSSVMFDQGFSAQDTRITIRGLAPTQGRQNVAILEDSIDVSSQAMQTNGGSLLINPRLFDLERIEVVKGPQNALYGRTAFAGAINYISRKPTEELETRVSTEIGSNGELQFKGGISGPIMGDTLLGAFTAASWENDGFYSNSVTGNDVGGEDGYGFTGTLLWKPTDRLSVTGRVTYSDDEYEVDPYVTIVPTTLQTIPASAIAGDVISESLTSILAVAGTLPDGDELRAATMSSDPRTGGEYEGTKRDVLRSTLTIAYDLGSMTLTSLTHFADADSSQFLENSREGDFSTQIYASETKFHDETQLFSQELRLQSNDNERVNWVVGGLYWDEDTDFTDSSLNCLQLAAGPAAPGLACGPALAAYPGTYSRYPDLWERDTKHWSVYALVDWAILDNLKLVTEARYSSEDVDVVGPDRVTAPRAIDTRPGLTPGQILAGLGPTNFPNVLGPSAGRIADDQDDDFISPKVTLQWSPADDFMTYFSWAEATKPKGIAVVANLSGFIPANSHFEDEKMQVWELGAKSTWLDGRLILNGALFFQDYTDKQLSSQVPVGNTLATRAINAGEAEVKGLELEASFRATDYLSLSGAYTYLDTEYTKFQSLDSGAGNIAAASNCTVVAPTGTPTCLLDLSGNELEYAPKNAFVGNVAYRRPLRGDTDWFVEGDVNYQDERYQRFLNTVKFDDYTTVDFRAGIANDQWEIVAYVENAFDDDTVKTGVNSTWNAGFAALPNYVGGVVNTPPTTPLLGFTTILPADIQVILPDERQFGLRVAYSFGGAN